MALKKFVYRPLKEFYSYSFEGTLLLADVLVLQCHIVHRTIVRHRFVNVSKSQTVGPSARFRRRVCFTWTWRRRSWARWWRRWWRPGPPPGWSAASCAAAAGSWRRRPLPQRIPVAWCTYFSKFNLNAPAIKALSYSLTNSTCWLAEFAVYIYAANDGISPERTNERIMNSHSLKNSTSWLAESAVHIFVACSQLGARTCLRLRW